MKYRILILLATILFSLTGIAQDNVTGVILNEMVNQQKR